MRFKRFIQIFNKFSSAAHRHDDIFLRCFFVKVTLFFRLMIFETDYIRVFEVRRALPQSGAFITRPGVWTHRSQIIIAVVAN